jgi:hypothetical protein
MAGATACERHESDGEYHGCGSLSFIFGAALAAPFAMVIDAAFLAYEPIKSTTPTQPASGLTFTHSPLVALERRTVGASVIGSF